MPTKTDDILKSLEPIATALKVTVEKVWGIFVRRYLAKGISQLLVAVAITAAAIAKLGDSNWIWLPLAIALLIAYNAVNLVINPDFFALTDIVERIKEETGREK